MELVVAVAIGVLTCIFAGSLIALIIICRFKYCNKQRDSDQLPMIKYVKDSPNEEGVTSDYGHSVDLDYQDVMELGPNIDQILKTGDFEYDKSGVTYQCICMLHICRDVCQKLEGLFISDSYEKELLEDVGAASRHVSRSVDDLVRSMYPPLDLPLLEARASALVLSVHNLGLVFKGVVKALRQPKSGDSLYVHQCLNTLDRLWKELHDAVHMEENGFKVAFGTPPPSATTALVDGVGGKLAGKERLASQFDGLGAFDASGSMPNLKLAFPLRSAAATSSNSNQITASVDVLMRPTVASILDEESASCSTSGLGSSGDDHRQLDVVTTAPVLPLSHYLISDEPDAGFVEDGRIAADFVPPLDNEAILKNGYSALVPPVTATASPLTAPGSSRNNSPPILSPHVDCDVEIASPSKSQNYDERNEESVKVNNAFDENARIESSSNLNTTTTGLV